ncbi:MAG TPA: septum formation family protein [Candidatus Limnocylindrales bacterium]|jgi:hypothetical protein
MTQAPDPNAMPGSSPPPDGPQPGPMGYQAPPSGPTSYMPPPVAPPKKKTNWLGIVVLVAIVGAIGGGFWLFRDRLSSNASELVVGDCFDKPAETETITDVQHQPCTSPHDREVITVLTHPAGPDDPYPVVSGFDDYIQENCVPAFETYTGRDADTESELNLGYFQPTLSGWGEGDRGLSCFISRRDGQQLHGSLRNIGTSPLP